MPLNCAQELLRLCARDEAMNQAGVPHPTDHRVVLKELSGPMQPPKAVLLERKQREPTVRVCRGGGVVRPGEWLLVLCRERKRKRKRERRGYGA